MDGSAGVTAMETSTGAVTVRSVDPAIIPEVAEIVDVPIFKLVARPPALIVAAAGADDAQVALLVRSCVLASVYVPVAVNCCVLPAARDGVRGVTAIETREGGDTVSVKAAF